MREERNHEGVEAQKQYMMKQQSFSSELFKQNHTSTQEEKEHRSWWETNILGMGYIQTLV